MTFDIAFEDVPVQEKIPAILIIEDDGADIVLLKNRLNSLYPHYNIVPVGTVRAAQDAFLEQGFDLVLLDLNLPDGYGPKTIEEVKKFNKKTPIVVITSMVTNITISEALNLGANNILMKSRIHSSNFKDALDPYLKKRKNGRRLQEDKNSNATADQYRQRFDKIFNEYQEFAYVVSHDLEAPVRQLQGLTQIILKDIDPELSARMQPYKEMLDQVSAQAEQNLSALLSFSRLNTGEKRNEEVDLDSVISAALKRLQDQGKGDELNILSSKMPNVYGDRDLLIDVFYYLIDNAIKFQPEDQEPRIEIGVNKQNGAYTFFIKDNGIGMRPEKIHHAFVILRTLNAKDLYGGNGIGLTFAKKIIELHNGNIFVDSSLGQGTKISFTLELKEDDKFENFRALK